MKKILGSSLTTSILQNHDYVKVMRKAVRKEVQKDEFAKQIKKNPEVEKYIDFELEPLFETVRFDELYHEADASEHEEDHDAEKD